MTPIDQDGWTNRKSLLFLPDGRPLTFIDTGGAGPVVLLLHGYSDTSRSFSLLEPWIGSYRLIMPDLPGHGGSSVGAGLTVGDFADDIGALIETLDIARCAVIGHSMGAMIAIVLAARLPQTVAALVAISGTLQPAFPPCGPVTAGILALADPIDPDDPFFDLWHAGPHPVERAFLDPVSREAAAIPTAIWHGILTGFSTLDLATIAAQVQAPVLCIGGSADALFDAQHRHALENVLADVKTVVLDGFGHNPHWEDPLRVAIHVERFLRHVAAPRSKIEIGLCPFGLPR